MNRWQHLIFRIVLILSVTLTLSAHAGDYTLVPEQFIYCTTCHGVELAGNRLVDAPRLAGIERWYAENQIRAFQKGWRGAHEQDATGMEMRAQVISLDDEQIRDAIAFITSVPARANRISPTVTGNIEKGKSLYVACAACHGQNGEGSVANLAPALAGQSDWYLVRQLRKFQNGVRGYVSADVSGKRMRAASALSKDAAAIESVAAYIDTL
uniref:Cytochrome c553 n=1 Tax=Candidatus Kentrum sp. LFY TaxID=2126342 RepID=A0A450X2W8_9GAMM|nr:MAG: Cytochrome c553 [Candidatus Kentron sp. LFY]